MKKINLLVNFGTLKYGGGQNVALNFISSLLDLKYLDETINYHFIIVRNSQIHNFFLENNMKNYFFVPSNPLLRILFEFLFGRYIIRKYAIDIIYSYFGMGLYPKNIPQITGSADSNLYYPDIKFWSQYSGLKLFAKKIIDRYRIWGLKRSAGIIFENEALELQCHNLFNIKETRFIKPSIFVDKNKFIDFNLKYIFKNDVKYGLFLCGWQLNKNIMKIPEIAKKLKSEKIKFEFILTAPDNNSKIHNEFLNKVKKYEVESMVHIVGQVKKEELSSLYNHIDLVFLLSKLESFSNNIIEAWKFKKILLVSSEPWAKSICRDGALYVNRESSSDILKKIKTILNDEIFKNKILDNAEKILQSYPTINERTKQELNYIKEIYEKN